MRPIVRVLALASLPLFLAPRASGQLRLRSRYILTSAEVARAIAKAFGRGAVRPLPAVQLLTDMTASEPDPQLEVTAMPAFHAEAMAGSNASRLLFRVACRTSAVCVPFYATATGTAAELPAAVQRPSPPPTMRSGAHATLFFETGGTRVEVPVISLQSGAEGQTIRAVGIDRKHVYMARVVAATLLKGEF